MRDPAFATIGLSEDVPKLFSYSDLGNQQAGYSLTVRFYLAEGLFETGSAEFLRVEECTRPIIAEVARLLFANPKLNNTVAESDDITAGIAYLYLRGKSYTGVLVEMPVIQEI